MAPTTIPVRGISKASDFQDVKKILTICGKQAKFHEVPFQKLANLIIFLLYNIINHSSENIGTQLNNIFKEVHSSESEWFYETWVHIDRRGKHTLQILEEVSCVTRSYNAIDYMDASYSMVNMEESELLQVILKYYQDGCPAVI